MDSSPLKHRDPLIGARLDGRYRISGVLGRGGMGVVYEGVHEQLARKVAIKVLSSAIATEPVVVQRFLREARIAASLGHGNIVDVSDLGHLPDGRPYLVMPKIEGTSFADLMAKNGTLPPARVIELLRGVAAALDLVHAKGLVHRDVKPENLMHVLREDGSETVMLMDFGIAVLTSKDAARLTSEGMVCGTPAYLAPEVARGEDTDHRADVYALAAVAFELLTGKLPFDADNPLKILQLKAFRDPPSLGSVAVRPFPESLERVVARGLARLPDERFMTAGSFVQALEIATTPIAVPRTEGAPTEVLGTGAPHDHRAFGEPPETARASDAVERDGAPGEDVAAGANEGGEQARTPAAPAATRSASEPPRVPRARGGWLALASVSALAVGAAAFATVWSTRGEPSAKPPATRAAPPSPRASLPERVPELAPSPAAQAAASPQPVQPARDVASPPASGPLAPVPEVRSDPSPRRRRPRDARPAAEPVLAVKPATSSTPDPASSPGAEELAKQASAAFMQGHLARAAELFEQATTRDARNVAAWRGLGLMNERLGRRDAAVRAYRRALELAPAGTQADAVRARLQGLDRE